MTRTLRETKRFWGSLEAGLNMGKAIRPKRHRNLAEKVRTVIQARISTGRPREKEVAQALRMSLRTFQRTLCHNGFTYRELLEASLRDLAERELSNPVVPIAAVASRVGFPDPANFSRAFRRWSGESPRAFRQSVIVPSKPYKPQLAGKRGP